MSRLGAFVVYVLAAVGGLFVLASVEETFRDLLGEVSYRWRKRLARRQGFVLRRWRLALGYRLMRPHIDAVDLWRKGYFDGHDERALGAILVVERVRQWRLNPDGTSGDHRSITATPETGHEPDENGSNRAGGAS